MEEIIEEEIDNLLSHIDNEWVNTPLDVSRFFNISSVSSLWRIISGERLKIGDPKLQDLMIYLQKFVLEFGSPVVSIFLNSSVKFGLIKQLGFTSIHQYADKMFQFCNEYIELHRKKPIDGDSPLTFIEAFLHKIQEQKNPLDPLHGDRGILNLQNTVLDLFMAGSDTTATTLNWAMMYMVLYPDIQTKVRNELNAQIGFKKAKVADKNLTPYVEAVIHEIQRKSSIAPFGVFHNTSHPMKVGKYEIPKNTAIAPMLSEIMHDPEYFPEPEEFNPERYLSRDENGEKKFTPNPKVIPFGTGKRRCLGENLARMSVYKFFTSLIQKYEIVSGQEEPILDEHSGGFILNPKPYKLKFMKIVSS